MSSRGIFLFFCVSFLYVILCVSTVCADQTGKVLGWGEENGILHEGEGYG